MVNKAAGKNTREPAADNAIGEQIRQALEWREVKAAELARHLGISRSAISQWWSQNPTSPLEQIGRVAELLHVNIDWLLTGQGEPLRENTLDVGAPVAGVMEAEAWREGTSLREAIKTAFARDAAVVPSVPNSSFPNLRQFAVEARGNSADLVIRPGEFAICVDYHDARPNGPQDGDLVVLEKRRAGGEYCVQIGRLVKRADIWQMVFESTDKAWRDRKPVRLSQKLTRDLEANTPLELVGFVLGIFRTTMPPPHAKALARAREEAVPARRQAKG